MRSPSLLSTALALTGCLEFGDEDAKVPGDPLGEYAVAAQLQHTDCGPEALGTPETWDFVVRLSRDGPDLFWLNGAEVIPGEIGPDGATFSFESEVAVQVEPAVGNQPGCSVLRTDCAEGTLVTTGPDVVGFSGQLSYGYAPLGESDCTPFLGAPGGFAALPCQMAYSLRAERISGSVPDG
jgi:hypothetical protein